MDRCKEVDSVNVIAFCWLFLEGHRKTKIQLSQCKVKIACLSLGESNNTLLWLVGQILGFSSSGLFCLTWYLLGLFQVYTYPYDVQLVLACSSQSRVRVFPNLGDGLWPPALLHHSYILVYKSRSLKFTLEGYNSDNCINQPYQNQLSFE